MQFLSKAMFPLLALFTLLLLNGCCPKNYIPVGEPAPLAPICLPADLRIALVLGSGGVRGMAHVGVLEEFEKAGIPFDIIVGCSAGGLVGALYADQPNACHVKHAVENMRTNTLLDINLWKCRFGLSQGKAVSRMLDESLSVRCFEELKIPLVVVATDLWTGELVPIGSGDLLKAVQASCSIPVVWVPIEFEGRILVDGGVINPVPVVVARDLGADLVIAVDLCELLPTTFPSNLFGVAKRSAEIAFLWQTHGCTKDADIIIRPKMRNVGIFNDKMMGELFEAGRTAARAAIPRLKELIAQLPEKPYGPQQKRSVQLTCYKTQDLIQSSETMEQEPIVQNEEKIGLESL